MDIMVRGLDGTRFGWYAVWIDWYAVWMVRSLDSTRFGLYAVWIVRSLNRIVSGFDGK